MPLVHLLFSCPWVPEWVWERKKTEYLTVHHCTTSECTISGTDEEDTSMLSHARTHTNTRWHGIVSPWRESKCWVSKSEHCSAEHFTALSVVRMHKREKREESIIIVDKTYSVVYNDSYQGLPWCWLACTELLLFLVQLRRMLWWCERKCNKQMPACLENHLLYFLRICLQFSGKEFN